jgi:hypothetical protein
MAGRERIAWFEFEPAKPQRLRDGVREDFTAAVRRGGLEPVSRASPGKFFA